MSDKKFLLKEIFRINSHKTQSIAKYLGQGNFAGSARKILKNREIIRTDGETGRNEPKWGDLPVGWREIAGL